VPEGLNPRMAASPCVVAANESTSCEYADVFIRTVSFSPSTGLPVKTPAKGISSDPSRAVVMSFGAKALSLSESSVGRVRAPAPVR